MRVDHIDTIAFDADDTLWHNEDGFHRVEHEFRDMVAAVVGPDVDVLGRLTDRERANVKVFGYGVKSFTFSMIETATELTEGHVSAPKLGEMMRDIIEHGRWLLTRPTEVFEDAARVIDHLSTDYRLVLITKGDPHHQLAKIDESGLRHHFHHVEVVSEKDPQTYSALAERHGFELSNLLMVGNSIKSDVLPVLAVGGQAAHIPYTFTWALEEAHLDEGHPAAHRVVRLEKLADVPALLGRD
jgi:putative hydrolase of the HAD superfamily